MVHFVKEYDYPRYVKSVRALSDFLRRKESWDEFEESALKFFMKAERIIGERLHESQNGSEYVKWCKKVEAIQLAIFANQFANLSWHKEKGFYVLISKCFEGVEYLTSEKCIQFYLDD